jgi:hypothetical protein
MRIQILYASPFIVTVIDTKVRLVMHVARMEAKRDEMQEEKKNLKEMGRLVKTMA